MLRVLHFEDVLLLTTHSVTKDTACFNLLLFTSKYCVYKKWILGKEEAFARARNSQNYK
jgi:hypothetical protein